MAIAELGEPESSSTIDIERLLEIRNSAECMEFKRWLDDADSLTDEDIKTLLVGIRSKLGLRASNVEGRMLRFAAITGIGLLSGGVIPATVLGFVDSFLVEKLFPKSGIVSFLKTQYPSVFER